MSSRTINYNLHRLLTQNYTLEAAFARYAPTGPPAVGTTIGLDGTYQLKILSRDSPNVPTLSLASLQTNRNFMKQLVRGLSYGSTYFNVQEPVTQSQIDLYFTNGVKLEFFTMLFYAFLLTSMFILVCFTACTSTSAVGCSTFGNAIMTHGLAAVFQEMFNQVQISLNLIVYTINKVLFFVVVDTSNLYFLFRKSFIFIYSAHIDVHGLKRHSWQ